MQVFKVPPKIYFEKDAIQYLEKMQDIHRALIVTDPLIVKLGNVKKLLYYLRHRQDYVHSEIWSDVEPDPTIECIKRGVKEAEEFKPDVIIALGGGSAIDTGKGIWLFYEHPDVSLDTIRQKFTDVRKGTLDFPQLGKKAKFVAIPTTSGTGSEVTAFSLFTDNENRNLRHALTGYDFTPDVTIVDPQFTSTQPKNLVAEYGLDVLTHCIESYVSVLASDYTDGLALHGIELVFEYLPKSYASPDPYARERMHNASTMAGMAFANTFLGLVHSMANQFGGEFRCAHQPACSILLPYVIKFNAHKPESFVSTPKYPNFIANERYADISKRIGLKCSNIEEGVNSLIEAVKKLAKDLDRPASFKEYGIDETKFLAVIDSMSEKALLDPCTNTNPRTPTLEEVKALFREAYYGN